MIDLQCHIFESLETELTPLAAVFLLPDFPRLTNVFDEWLISHYKLRNCHDLWQFKPINASQIGLFKHRGKRHEAKPATLVTYGLNKWNYWKKN
mmetsp:Transcript_15744/g.20948  ORF Transcript_15744/g.20948 Transcript_15744/m.20948 type:complete len:94 (+) Transcript_15744:511-792(+)